MAICSPSCIDFIHTVSFTLANTSYTVTSGARGGICARARPPAGLTRVARRHARDKLILGIHVSSFAFAEDQTSRLRLRLTRHIMVQTR
jgi:hypothetical protein